LGNLITVTMKKSYRFSCQDSLFQGNDIVKGFIYFLQLHFVITRVLI